MPVTGREVQYHCMVDGWVGMLLRGRGLGQGGWESGQCGALAFETGLSGQRKR